ncbi:MAG: rRNA maturation RNase YbeY [Stenotrophobium sp.]
MSAIVIQRRVPAAGIPAAASLRSWAQSALKKKGDLTIRIVDETESEALNGRYRKKHKPTNVLSFGYGESGPHPANGSAIGPPLSRLRERDASRRFPTTNVLGDLVICAPVVVREAREQKKSARTHWAHMVVHGCLHLQGYDHENDVEAAAMEALEIRILEQLGFENPYQET